MGCDLIVISLVTSSIAHCSDVEESIQTGESWTEKAEASCSCMNLSGCNPARMSSAPCLQNTEPCCCPAPDMAATLANSTPATLSLSSSMSRAFTHMMVGAVTLLPDV